MKKEVVQQKGWIKQKEKLIIQSRNKNMKREEDWEFSAIFDEYSKEQMIRECTRDESEMRIVREVRSYEIIEVVL